MRTSIKKDFFYQPYHLFLPAALQVLVLPFFYWGEGVAIRLLGTGFLVSGDIFTWFISFILLLAWIIYLLTNKLLWSKYLTWVHVIVTTAILTILTTGLWHEKISGNGPQVYLYQTLVKGETTELKFSSPAGLLFIAGQLAYLVNLSGGLIRRRFATASSRR